MLSFGQMWSVISTHHKVAAPGKDIAQRQHRYAGWHQQMLQCRPKQARSRGQLNYRCPTISTLAQVLTDDRIDRMRQGGQLLVHSKMGALVVMACCFPIPRNTSYRVCQNRNCRHVICNRCVNRLCLKRRGKYPCTHCNK